MAGRFPFDPNNPHNNPGNRVTNAQMRAALGLPSVDELSANLYVEQQQRLEVQQRDLRYRHSLYQDQLDHQLQELQLRANAVAELEQIPDLQAHYAQLLRAELARGSEAEQAAVAAHQRLNQEQQLAAAAAYRRQQEHHYAIQLRHQQELIRQQQAAALQAHLARSSSAPAGSVPPGLDQLLRSATGSGSPLPPTLSGTSGVVQSIPQLPVAQQAMAKLVPQAPAQHVASSVASGTSASGSVQEAPPSTKPKMAPPSIVDTTIPQPQTRELSRQSSVDSVELEDMVIEQHKKRYPALPPPQEKKKSQLEQQKKKTASKRSRASSDVSAASLTIAPDETKSKELPSKRKRGRPKREIEQAPASKPATPKPVAPKQPKKKEKSLADENEQKLRAEAILQVMAERAAGMQWSEEASSQAEEKVEEDRNPTAFHPKKKQTGAVGQGARNEETANISEAVGEIAVTLVEAVESVPAVQDSVAECSSPILNVGTVEGLLQAAKAEDKAFNVAHILEGLKEVEWPDSDDESEKAKKAPPVPAQVAGLPLPVEPLESIVTTIIESHFPRLPEEPVFDEKDLAREAGGGTFGNRDSADADQLEVGEKTEVEEILAADGLDSKISALETEKDSEPKKSRVLDYPYPVDTWWPSSAGRRRERRHGGETSDEDVFQEPAVEPGVERPLFRANDRKIKQRLQTELEPGVLEKLSHCRIHRMKRKNTPLAELVYCFQVTECYPKDVMVCCSVCGSWRHAACGGHFEPYSVRKNIEEPFVAVCEQCHEEQQILEEYPIANARIERQRMEQLRRGLATTAVMRSMSFSKHGGTYKWPLGSVSATHVGGHTRSVQARHDKAEKQWADLLTRLGRGYGYRTKERQRIRTKELERLLVAIEDAEGQTDRHNMLLFLMRDTQKPMPAGFEDEHKNLFDPCYTDDEFDSLGYTPISRRSENPPQKQRSSEEEGGEEQTKKLSLCIRDGCKNETRFDSLFCSDGCGVHVLEKDLLQAFYESNEIHPSVLRSHY